MSELRDRIAEYEAAKAQRVPAETLQTMAEATRGLEAMGITDRSLKTGQRVPDLALHNHCGELRRD